MRAYLQTCSDSECRWVPIGAELVLHIPIAAELILAFRIAEDKWYTRLSSSAKKHFNEMGMVQISLVAFVDRSGNLNVNMCVLLTSIFAKSLLISQSHDEVAKLLGATAMPFDVMFSDKAKEIKKLVMEYLKTIRRDHSQSADNETSNGFQRNFLETDPSGYPIAPHPHSWSKVTRADLEPLYRMYIKRHYRMLYYFLFHFE